MIHLALRTEYSFRRAFGRLEDVVRVLTAQGCTAAAITDRGTWGHVAWAKALKPTPIKPLFGAELMVVADARVREKQVGAAVVVLARSLTGLREVYRLVTVSNLEGFYYIPRVDWSDLRHAAERDVYLICGPGTPLDKAPERVLLAFTPTNVGWNRRVAADAQHTHVVTGDNHFPTPSDRAAYEVLAQRDKIQRPTPMHILNEDELRLAIPQADDAAFANNRIIADQCNAAPQRANNIRIESEQTLLELCLTGAAQRGLELNDEYRARLDRELAMIAEKQFEDYFYLVGDMVRWAKRHMLVGPARGSSAGSLACYLLGITDVDPLVHGLMFERFIDVTRADLPDVDIDFQDDRRDMVIQYLKDKYGEDRVGRIGTVARLKAKSCLADVGRELQIPLWEVKTVQDAIIERSTGDSRARFCVQDTLDSLEVGKAIVAKYPKILIAGQLEDHPQHHGKHAAGLIVAQEPVVNYCSIDREGVAQLDKHDAEALNMLKIDALGLRTLSIIQDTLDQAGKDRDWLVNYSLDDEAAFALLNAERWAGIFQFEGYALQSLTRQMRIESFQDLAIIGALARPGPLNCGAATQFIERRNGRESVVHMHELVAPITADTLGVVIYQEQVMAIGRAVGQLDWQDVSELRKAMSKTLGEEFFNRYWEKFREGSRRHGIPDNESRHIWERMCTFGCLGGDTEIRLPASNQYSPQSLTIAELYANGGHAQPTASSSNRAAQKKRGLSKVFNLQDGSILPARPNQILQSGVKTTYQLTLQSGKKIRATKNHLFLTQNRDWQSLDCLLPGEMIATLGQPFKPRDWKGTGSGAHNHRHGQSKLFLERVQELRSRFDRCQRCLAAPYQETHHKDADRLNNDWGNLLPVCRVCHKELHRQMGLIPAPWQRGRQVAWERVAGIDAPREEMTYDICMPEPYNNFAANDIIVHNSWAFNKSHGISYGIISYWCCVLKAHWPLEFAAACLRNVKDEQQGVHILRDLKKEGYDYTPVDPQRSGLTWSVVDGRLIGGLTNIKGVGIKKAEDILKRRSEGRPLQPGQVKLLTEAKTPYDDIFEGERRFSDIYEHPEQYMVHSGKVMRIVDIEGAGQYVFLAKIAEKNLRDLNEYGNVVKRGGRLITGNAMFLNLTLEDDTGSIMARIDRYNYGRWGKRLVDWAKIGEWFLWKGYIKEDGWRQIQVIRWRCLEEGNVQLFKPWPVMGQDHHTHSSG